MKLLIVSGSIRSGRTTHKVAKALAKTAQDLGIETNILDLKTQNLPQYGADLNADEITLKENIGKILEAADTIIITTPEYNGFFSSALKSLFDYYKNAVFAGKAIGTATVSVGGMGGMRAAQNLQLQILGVSGFPNPKMLLTGLVNQKFDETDQVIDEAYQEKMTDFVQTIIDQAKKLSV